MRGGIDAAGKARDDGKPCLAEVAREPAGHFGARGRSIARADDGDHRPIEQGSVAVNRDQRRRIVDPGERAGIFRLAQAHQPHAERAHRCELALGFLARSNARGVLGAAAARQAGKGF